MKITEQNSSGISISTTLIPYADIIKNIGKEKVNVETLMKPGQNPHSFEPLPEQIKSVSQSQIYFQVSSVFPIENMFIKKIKENNRSIRVVDLALNLDLKGNDPHVWLSPKRVLLIAKNILDAMNQVDIKNKKFYTKNYVVFIKKIHFEDSLMSEMVKQKKLKYLVVYHSAWKYFCDDYGIQEISIEENGKSPQMKQMKDKIKLLKELSTTTIFSDPQFDTLPVNTIANSIGAKVELLNPLPQNYIENLKDIREKLNKSMK